MNEGAGGPYARPAPGFAGQPQPSTQEQTYVDGFRPGDVKYSYGVLALLLQVNPGWYLADGTVTLQDGTTPPDLRGRFIIGADGATFPLGGTGGSDAHVHPFTHELAHAITQPVFGAPAAHVITQPVFDAPAAHGITQPVFAAPAAHSDHSHDNNHTVTQPTAHGITQPIVASHTPTSAVQVALGTSGAFVLYYLSGAAAVADINHPLTVNVALTNNHSGTAVTAHSNHAHDHNHDALTRSTDVALTNNHGALNRSVDVALTNNHAAPARTTDVALSNNAPHAGGSVDAATGDNRFPKYAALWPLIKKF